MGLVEVESSGIIDASIENLWELISDFNNITQWHPDVTECRLESGSARQIGAVRSVRLRNGISIRERLLAISPQDRFYTYSVIESPLPIGDHESTVRFKSLNSSQTQVKWTAQFMAAEGDAKA